VNETVNISVMAEFVVFLPFGVIIILSSSPSTVKLLRLPNVMLVTQLDGEDVAVTVLGVVKSQVQDKLSSLKVNALQSQSQSAGLCCATLQLTVISLELQPLAMQDLCPVHTKLPFFV
jgi:hypothetical protein